MLSPRQLVALDQPGVRVQTLVLLRWTAIAGQLLALLVVGLGFHFPIPWAPALAAVVATVVVLAVLFGIAAIVYGVLALIHVATTPRVSFSESYDDAPTVDDPVVTETASITLEKASTREKASTPEKTSTTDTASKNDA